MVTESLLTTCIMIFFGRILDVSLSTIKVVLTVKEKTVYAAFTGFTEILLWYLIVKNALSSDGPVIVIALAYSCGYAAGTYIGGMLSKRIIGGHLVVDVITSNRDLSVVEQIRTAGYAVTVLEANSYSEGNERFMLVIDIDKKKLKHMMSLINELDPKAYLIIREEKQHIGGYYSDHK